MSAFASATRSLAAAQSLCTIARRAWPAGHDAVHAAQGDEPDADHVEPAEQGVEETHVLVAEFHAAPVAQTQPLWPVAELPLLYVAPVGHAVQLVLPADGAYESAAQGVQAAAPATPE